MSRSTGLALQLGRAIRRRRSELGQSQEAFAEGIGLHRTYLGGIERGERNLTLKNLVRIAEGLGVQPSTLLQEAESGPPDGREISEPSASAPPTRIDHILMEMEEALRRSTDVEVLPRSDICSAEFVQEFTARLLLHHSMNEEPLKKKAFEFAFLRAARADGKTATLSGGATNPGADVTVGGVDFSLKTEAAAGIKKDFITISKLMEARWIRESRTGADYVRGLSEHVLPHLRRYERILLLRAFAGVRGVIRYELVEIPVRLLLAVGTLGPGDFSARTKNGSSKADVYSGNARAFVLRLDGSVEKVTVTSLRRDICRLHATWRLRGPATEP